MLFNIPSTNRAIEECLNSFYIAMQTVRASDMRADYNADIRDFIDNVTSMLTHAASPAEYFTPIECGSFKECYEAPGNWIIKFAASFNNTQKERGILAAAREYGLNQLFLPTIFIELPVNLPITQLDSEYSPWSCEADICQNSCSCNCCECEFGHQRENDSYLTTAILQPRAVTANNLPYVLIPDQESYLKYPLTLSTGDVIPWEEMIYHDIECRSWVEDIITQWGDKTWEALSRFMKDFCITDLHRHNIGYLKTPSADLPVIFDWLSSRED